jgi:hypothetical protein
LNHKHIPEFFLSSKEKILSRSISIFDSVDGKFLDAVGVPFIDIRVQKKRPVAYDFTIVNMGRYGVWVRQTDEIMRMVASKFRGVLSL